ncbi:hypothetical protein [Clostridium sp. 'White wine YQ']|uniref:hypothetical protein n=1 Tax=Clostridium sp. 'White wine YQ' TaxID=3027474 RepID=UPI0023661B95|nr:hypothetical protein [Clostridium sp. 'White wine YQ']MDD7792742.1 hypothetical protein [Clostridium sp. 'White wine YQ']
MNKTKLAALVISGVMLTSTAVYAKGKPENPGANKANVVSQDKNQSSDAKQNNGSAQKEANQAKKDEKKQQISEFKTAMKAKHETMKQIRQQTIQVRQQIEAKTEELNSILEDIKAGNKTLPEDMLNDLLAKAAVLNTSSGEVKATTGVSTVEADTQDKVEKKDFSNALASMDKVIAKLQARLDALNKLNSNLDDALAIARQAAAPAKEDPSTSTGQTSPTDTTTPSDTTTDTSNTTNTSK